MQQLLITNSYNLVCTDSLKQYLLSSGPLFFFYIPSVVIQDYLHTFLLIDILTFRIVAGQEHNNAKKGGKGNDHTSLKIGECPQIFMTNRKLSLQQ